MELERSDSLDQLANDLLRDSVDDLACSLLTENAKIEGQFDRLAEVTCMFAVMITM